MSEKEIKSDYTVKNFDILNKHVEEGIAREKEITRSRRAKTNWQNAKNISLVILALGLLAIMIGLAIRIAQKDYYLGSNHSHSGNSNNHMYREYYGGNTSNQNPLTSNNDTSNTHDMKKSTDSLQNKENNYVTQSKENKNNSELNPDNAKLLVSPTETINQNSASEANNSEDESIIQKSKRGLANLMSKINPRTDQADKSDDATRSKQNNKLNDSMASNNMNKFEENNKQQLDNLPNNSDPRSSSQNNNNQKKDGFINKNNQEPQNLFFELYESKFNEKLQRSSKPQKIIKESGEQEIIKNNIHYISKPTNVMYKNTKYEIYTTYYFKSTEREDLVYPFKQQCWAYTPAKIVLHLNDKYLKRSVTLYPEKQELALKTAGLNKNELISFHSSCRFL